jgi:hypothetical protein
MPSRRTVLSGASVLGVSALSGCASILGQDSQYLHFVSVFNRSATPHDIGFNVYDDSGESLYSYYNTFPPDHTQRHHVFEGTPARVFARMDSSDQVDRRWSTDVCGERSTGRSGLLLSVSEQAEMDTLELQWECQPVTRESE